jgi:YggT family protein
MNALQFFFSTLLTILWWALLARVVLSWIATLAPGNSFTSTNNPIVQLVLQVTDPILVPLRRIVPTIGMFDFTPLIAFFIIILLRQLVRSL